jgi:hypothetical protein
MILNAITEKLKRQSNDDFKGRHFEAWLIVQAVTWYVRYPLSYRDLEQMFAERGFEVDHSTINRWVLSYAPMIEKRLRQFRKPHCGSVRIDETYVKIRGKWHYLYRGACRKDHLGPQLSVERPGFMLYSPSEVRRGGQADHSDRRRSSGQKSRILRNHSMASKPAIVFRAVLNNRNPPIFGMFFLTRKWSLSMPCWRCLVT